MKNRILPAPAFPGISSPSTDFESVIDGRRAPPMVIDIDLSTARSLLAGTEMQLKITGNSFYIDQAPEVGNARVIFEGVQDRTGPEIRPAIFVQPGYVAKVPFANIMVQNTAQAGKVLRIVYGVDIDFVPSLNGQVTISGAVNSTPSGYRYAASYKSITSMGANTPDTVFAPGVNVNGAIIWRAQFISATGAGNAIATGYVANGAPPASIIDGDVILLPSGTPNGAVTSGLLEVPVMIPAGKGLYFISTVGESANSAARSVLYTLL